MSIICHTINNAVNTFESGNIQDEKNTNVNNAVIFAFRVSGSMLISRRLFDISQKSSLSDRKSISEFSKDSARRMRRYLRECTSEYTTMLTLTYPSGHGYDGVRAKRDLATLVKRIKRNDRNHRDDFSLFWFMEFQGRGSIHFHCFTNRFVDKDWLARNWYEICGTDDERHLRAGTRAEQIRSGRHGISAYASKYAAKNEQKAPPEEFGWVGRFWGVCGVRSTMAADMRLKPYMLEDHKIRECVEKIDLIISEAEKAGTCTIKHMENAEVSCVMFRDQKDATRIAGQINWINLRIALEYASDFREFQAELMEDISWEL